MPSTSTSTEERSHAAPRSALENDWSALPSDYASLRAYFGPLFNEIAAGALDREQRRILPYEQIRALNTAGFGALRVPARAGGPEVSIETFTRLLIDLAQSDPNIAHQYRSHFGFLDSLRFQPRAIQDHWYPRVLAGSTVGNASTERGGNALGRLNTTLGDVAGTTELNGTKYYSTGTIFATHTRVSANLEGREGRRFAVVPIDAPGVTVEDDWDGFGQQLTGTGTTIFDHVPVEPLGVLDREAGGPEAIHEAAFFQLILLAVLAGIATAARRDAAATIAGRKRTFNTGLGLPFAQDPLIQETTGRIGAKAYAASAVVVETARVLDAGIAGWEDGGRADTAAAREALAAGEVAVEQAQITVPELALAAAQDLFLTTGASATSRAKGLDRHWRNAQTVATHNPIAFRARALGDYWINGTLPEGLNAIGDAKTAGDAQEGR